MSNAWYISHPLPSHIIYDAAVNSLRGALLFYSNVLLGSIIHKSSTQHGFKIFFLTWGFWLCRSSQKEYTFHAFINGCPSLTFKSC